MNIDIFKKFLLKLGKDKLEGLSIIRCEGTIWKRKLKSLLVTCLLGDNVKYSGGNNLTPELVTLLEKYNVDIIKVCPECFGGLPIPRVPSEIKKNKVFSKDNRDVTEEFLTGAEKTFKIAKENDVNFAILKERSPSCGSTHIYDGTFSGNIIPGQGITAKDWLKKR